MAALQPDPCALLPFSAGQLTPMQAIEARHAVRSYTDEPLAPEAVEVLQKAIARVNEEANLNIQLVLDEPRAFAGFKARLVNFTNVSNYLALVGPECRELDGIVGYYGEQLVLLAQSLGLNSCWVGGTYKVPHRSKARQEVAPGYDGAPEWFKRGVDAALLAPTALNQQKFSFSLDGEENDVPVVRASTKRGAFTQMDLGIAQCHFEIGAGNVLYRWSE